MAWIGFVVVAQNVLGSLFNSHISDFTQGWLYVIGVGVLGAASSRGAQRRQIRHERRLARAEKANLNERVARARANPGDHAAPARRRAADDAADPDRPPWFPGCEPRRAGVRGGERILAGNPDINDVVVMSERPSAAETWALIRHLWRRYDFVSSARPGDRPVFFALVAGRLRSAWCRLPARLEPGGSASPITLRLRQRQTVTG